MEHGTTRWEVIPALPPEAGPAQQEAAGPAGAGLAAEPEVTRPPVPQPRNTADWRDRWPLSSRAWGWAGWPLAAILVVQAVLSARLIGADTAYQDEAAYLWAGHLQWAHWLHGVAIPPFSYYFSGAPVIYPPLGALADAVGGLAGARVLSLVFMLGATSLVWATAGRLFGRRAAFFAAALFAVLGPTLHLGSFGTNDALSVLLIALAAWLVVSTGSRRPDATGQMVLAGLALAVANATAYSSVLFDLVVLALAVLAALPSGRRVVIRRVLTLLIVAAALLAAALLIGGAPYLSGFKRTTLTSMAGAESAGSVLADTWSWSGILIVLAVCGVVASAVRRQRPAQTLSLAVLAAAAVLGPLEQARIHSADALNKHVGLGAWFAAIAAGYAADLLITAAPAGRTRVVTCAACVVAMAFPASLGATQSHTFATSWPDSASFTAILGPLADQGNGRLLVEDPSIAEYYLAAGSQWQRWSSTRNIALSAGASTGHPSQGASVAGAGNPQAYAKYIAEGYFSIVALNFADTTALDHSIRADLKNNPDYHIVQVIPYGIEVPPVGQGTYVIWRYEPSR
jgi:hypothetical protein